LKEINSGYLWPKESIMRDDREPLDKDNHAMDETRYFFMWKVKKTIMSGGAIV